IDESIKNITSGNQPNPTESSPFRWRGGLGIIRYGAGNIFSLTAALDRLGIAYGMVHTEADFEQFDRFIIPGVGHAGAAMFLLLFCGLVVFFLVFLLLLLGFCVG